MAKKHARKNAPAFDVTDVVVEAPAVEAPAAENLTTESPAAEIVSPEAPVVESKPVKVRYAKRVWAQGDIITLNTPNPKSGKSKNRYDLYVTGMSVAEYATAVVNHGGSKTLANADLRWDVARGFITISAPVAE